MSEEYQDPSIDGYYRELHIKLISPTGELLKTVIMPLNDLMPEHGSWRNAAANYVLNVEYIMRGGFARYPLNATAFWNQEIG